MENHFHLILHTPAGNLNRFAQRFNTAYTVYYNRRHNRSGHLYQGRYKAILIEKDSYLLALSRYIHLNPVKIKKIQKLSVSGRREYLRKYRWSSNHGYRLLRYRNDFVCYRNVLEYTGGDNTYGRKRYREFVEERLIRDVESPCKDMKGQVVIGGSRFIDWLYEKVLKNARPDRTEQSKTRELVKDMKQEFIIETVCNFFEIKREELLKRRSIYREARMVYIDLCCQYRLYHKSLREIGQELGGLTVGGMCQVRKRLKEKMQKDDSLMLLYNQCNKALSDE